MLQGGKKTVSAWAPLERSKDLKQFSHEVRVEDQKNWTEYFLIPSEWKKYMCMWSVSQCNISVQQTKRHETRTPGVL